METGIPWVFKIGPISGDCVYSRSKNYGATNRMTSEDWVAAIASHFRNIPDCRHRAWYKEFLSRKPHNDIFCQAVPWPYTSLDYFCVNKRSKALCGTSILNYFLISIFFPQQCSSPLPPRVTINSAPHTVQTYLLPT